MEHQSHHCQNRSIAIDGLRLHRAGSFSSAAQARPATCGLASLRGSRLDREPAAEIGGVGRGLVRERRLVRLATASTVVPSNPASPAGPMLYSPDAFFGAAREALDKLGVEWEPTSESRGGSVAISATAMRSSSLNDRPTVLELEGQQPSICLCASNLPLDCRRILSILDKIDKEPPP